MNVIKLFTIFSLIYVITALDCSQRWECQPVSKLYNYVDCVNSTCQCVLSFDGDANPSSQCDCPEPKKVYWDTDPYCLSLEDCAKAVDYADRGEKLKQVVNDFYDTFIYPGPILVLTGQLSVDNLLSDDVKGRITPLGILDSKDMVLDYWYGLAITPSPNQPTTTTIGYHHREISADGQKGKVFITTDVKYNDTSVDPPRIYNITDIGTFDFDEDDKIVSFDIILREFGKASDPPEVAKPFLVQGTCSLITITCAQYLGTEGFYDDYDDCVDYMTNLPFGTFDRAGSDSYLCRLFYALMTQYHPAIHCPSVSKTGGTQCIDVDYDSYYEVDF